ncbi:hypothetical protein ACFL2J_01925 [Candidatus Omnitrophota bacterium]
MDVLTKFNLYEAILWFAIAGVFLLLARRKERFLVRQRKSSIFLSAMFILCGISDLIEIHTGAWWHPTWLLIFKAICFFGIFSGLITFLRKK